MESVLCGVCPVWRVSCVESVRCGARKRKSDAEVIDSSLSYSLSKVWGCGVNLLVRIGLGCETPATSK